MDFRLPFPTLKHLTMVCIGKVTLDKEIRPLKKLRERNKDYTKIYTFEVEKIVGPVEIPATLKHDLSDVITGMFRQVERSKLCYDLGRYMKSKEFHKRLDNRELLYDVHGRLDLGTFWKRFFDNEVSGLDSLHPLLDLLDFVKGQGLHHGLDAIVSKILSVVCDDSTVSFKKRKLVRYRSTPQFGFGYAFVYRFDNSETATRCLSQFESIFRGHRSVGVSKDALFVYLCYDFQHRLEYEFFRDYFLRAQRSMNEREKLTFVSKVLYDWSSNSKCVIEILKTLNWEKQRQCFVAVLKLESDHSDDHSSAVFADRINNMFFRMLDFFLQWPHTHFFMPFLEFALPYLSIHELHRLFTAIRDRIPKSGRFGVIYDNLLAKFWQTIPQEVKQELRTAGCNRAGCDHVAVL